eukprot:TRINITY_DN6522_c0_g1_i4.p2 TRINITY_DN6522_c0_g1~~TRINITY_DN6522_c0_g1_i4.p2  ORF type:complete len:371 (-),score=87.49 TRINITY_DN6522_c0_g1_i4:71-1183(-)
MRRNGTRIISLLGNSLYQAEVFSRKTNTLNKEFIRDFVSFSKKTSKNYEQFLVPGIRHYANLPQFTQLTMPSLSPTMEQGNVASWEKKVGDSVNPGDVLANIETDKATMAWEAQEEGYLAKILIEAGTKDIKVGTPMALLVEEEDQVAAMADYVPGSTPTPDPAQQPSGGSFPPYQAMQMPALSPTMERGNIVDWKKKEGDEIAPGDLLCDVETDKATVSWESQDEGFLAKILYPAGSSDIQIGTPVAVLVEDQESVGAFASFTVADFAGGKPAAGSTAYQFEDQEVRHILSRGATLQEVLLNREMTQLDQAFEDRRAQSVFEDVERAAHSEIVLLLGQETSDYEEDELSVQSECRYLYDSRRIKTLPLS